MLTPAQKATILGKAGFQIPASPAPTRAEAADQDAAAQDWIKAVETLYVSYVAARAAKSLRDAEEARQLAMLRRLSLKSYA